MQKDLVSVVIPSFDRYEYLMNALNSINNQSYKKVEIIVVNDGSSQKEYYEKTLPFGANMLHIDRNDTPAWGGSRPAVRNYGIDAANGEFVAFLDDDDIWLPDKLDKQIYALKQNDAGFSCTEGFFGYGVYDESKKYPLYNSEHHFKKIKKKYKRSNYLKKNTFPEIWNYDFLIRHNSVVLSSVLVKTDIIKQLGGFRGLYRSSNFKHTADHDCWLGLIQLTNLFYVNEPLFYYDASHGGGKKYIN